jgi:putative tricarboxylic transport membrane protein
MNNCGEKRKRKSVSIHSIIPTFHDSPFKGFAMRRWERIGAVVLFFFGGGAAALALRMGFGDLRHPGPGFFPFCISAILLFLSLIYYLTRLGPDSRPGFLWQKGAWIRPSLAALVMFVYTLLMGELGFFSSTLLLFLAWREKWKTIVLVSSLGTFCFYLVFNVFLKVPLPKGLLF